jgi:hypothetical protein
MQRKNALAVVLFFVITVLLILLMVLYYLSHCDNTLGQNIGQRRRWFLFKVQYVAHGTELSDITRCSTCSDGSCNECRTRDIEAQGRQPAPAPPQAPLANTDPDATPTVRCVYVLLSCTDFSRF